MKKFESSLVLTQEQWIEKTALNVYVDALLYFYKHDLVVEYCNCLLRIKEDSDISDYVKYLIYSSFDPDHLFID